MRAARRRFCGLWVPVTVAGILSVGCDRRAELATVTSEYEANRILVALSEHNFKDAEKRPRKEQRATVWQVVVPEDQLQGARAVLVGCGLPREPQPGFDQMLSHTGLIPTKSDERARLMHALAGELSRTFEAIDGVVQARVHVVVPEQELLGAARTGANSDKGTGQSGAASQPAPKAAVVIRHLESARVQESQIESVVANAVEGLGKENVEIVMIEVPTPGGWVVRPKTWWEALVEAIESNWAGILLAVLAIALAVRNVLLWRKLRSLELAVQSEAKTSEAAT